jgi:hypothetical protein
MNKERRKFTVCLILYHGISNACNPLKREERDPFAVSERCPMPIWWEMEGSEKNRERRSTQIQTFPDSRLRPDSLYNKMARSSPSNVSPAKNTVRQAIAQNVTFFEICTVSHAVGGYLLFMPEGSRRSLWRDAVDVTARYSSTGHTLASRPDHHLQPRWVLLLPRRRGLQGHKLFWCLTLGQVTARHHRSH